MRCLSDVSIRSPLRETSQKPLKNISEKCLFCDVFKTSQVHLKKVVFHVTFLRRLKRISKTCQFYDVSDTSQNNLLKVFLTIQKNPTKMVFLADKTDLGPLKTLKKWNVVFWEQCIAINQSVMSISGLMFACCLSQYYGLQIIWQFYQVRICPISVADVFFTAFSDFSEWWDFA